MTTAAQPTATRDRAAEARWLRLGREITDAAKRIAAERGKGSGR